MNAESHLNLNNSYRNGGNPIECRDGGTVDLLGEMTLARKRHDILANDLIRMGVYPNGDDPGDD